MDHYHRILVIRGGAIGDFILTLPVFSVLKKKFPQTSISLLGYSTTGQLASKAGLIDEIRSIESPDLAGFFSQSATLDPSWKEYFKRFDLIVSYISDPDQVFVGNLKQCTSAKIIQGRHRPDEHQETLASDVFLHALAQLQISLGIEDNIPRLRYEGSPPQPFMKGFWIAMHPGSGSVLKNWPESQWSKLLMALLSETSWNFLLIGGEAEGERLVRLSHFIPESRKYLAQNVSLVGVAIMLQHCHLYLGHDSGITHLAAAVGLPGLVLWGPSNLNIWRPRSDRLHIMHSPNGLSALSAESSEVVKRLKTHWCK